MRRIPDVARKGSQPRGTEVGNGPLEQAGSAGVVCIEEDEECDADAGDASHEDVVDDAPGPSQ